MLNFKFYNVCLEFSNETQKKIIEISQKLAEKADVRYCLDGVNRYPHQTLYSFEILEEDVERVRDIVAEISKKYSKISLKINKPVKGFKEFVVSMFEKNDELQSLHEELVFAINPLRYNRIPEKYIKYPLNSDEKNSLKNIIKFGFPGALEDFGPHITYVRYQNEKDAISVTENFDLVWDIDQIVGDRITFSHYDNENQKATLIEEFELK